MNMRQFKISTVGALSLSLAAGCDDKGDDSGDAESAGGGGSGGGGGIVGTWNLTSIYGYSTDTYFNYSETYGECVYTYTNDVTMTFGASSTLTYDGELQQAYSYSDSCNPEYDYTYDYSINLTATTADKRSYQISDEDGFALACQLAGNTLSCAEGEGEDPYITFER